MNKADLIAALEEKLGSRQAANDAVNVVVDTIVRAVSKGERVAISGFGTFEKVQRAARTGRNPRTGETVRIKKTSVPRFKPGGAFKGFVASPRSIPKTMGGSVPVTARSGAGSASSAGTKKKATAKKATRKKAAAKKTTAKKTTARKATAKKATAKKTTARKSAATPKKRAVKSVAKKTTRAAAKKSTAKKSTARKTAVSRTKKVAPRKAVAKTATRRKSLVSRVAGGRKRR